MNRPGEPKMAESNSLNHPAFFGPSAFVIAGLVFAGIIDWCGMGMLIVKILGNNASGDARHETPDVYRKLDLIITCEPLLHGQRSFRKEQSWHSVCNRFSPRESHSSLI